MLLLEEIFKTKKIQQSDEFNLRMALLHKDFITI